MIDRRIESVLLDKLGQSPSVALIGPRQVGKTSLALKIQEHFDAVYLDLENRVDREKVSDIHAFQTLNRGKLIILDEVHRLPDVFTQIRGIIDQERRRGNKTGLFLFLGSASMDLLRQSGESLAGRIAYLELFPINVSEYAAHDWTQMNKLWLRGGFPESLLASSDKQSLSWRKDFIRTYLERDVPLFGARIPSETLGRFWNMLAHHQGGLFNASTLARSLDVSSVTISRYLDLLVDLLLVRRLQPWTSNEGKRLIKSPKIYICDSGVVHALLNIPEINYLLGHPVVGGSWEGFVIENILSVLPDFARPYFYRTSAGAEIDLVIEFADRERWAIEIKKDAVPHVSKGFHLACADIGATRKFIVHGGHDSFIVPDQIHAVTVNKMLEYILALAK